MTPAPLTPLTTLSASIAKPLTDDELRVYAGWFYQSLRTKPNLTEHEGIWSRFERLLATIDALRTAQAQSLTVPDVDKEKLAQFLADWWQKRKPARPCAADYTLAAALLKAFPGLTVPQGWRPIENYPRDHFARPVWSEQYGSVIGFLDATWTWHACNGMTGEELPSPPLFWMERLSRPNTPSPPVDPATSAGDGG